MFRRLIGKVSSSKMPITAMGIIFPTMFVCYRIQKTRDDFIKRDLFDRIIDREKPISVWTEEHRSDYIDCTGLNPYDVLAHLYNSSKPLGMGCFQANYTVMNREEAKKILDETLLLDYVHGRPIKLDFETWPYLYPNHYDKRNGNKESGTMRKLITDLRDSGKISTDVPREITQQELDEIVAKSQEALQLWS